MYDILITVQNDWRKEMKEVERTKFEEGRQ